MRDDVARLAAAKAIELARSVNKSRGPQGAQGLQGERGEKGDKGDVGPRGPQGLPGRNGFDGLDGAPGPQGERGEDGQAGPAGDVGPQGPDGPQGESGPKGDKGERGERGLQGDIGPMPKHERKGYQIRFEKAPGVWGDWIVIPIGGNGGGRDDKLTDLQKQLVEIGNLIRTQGDNNNRFIKTVGGVLQWDTLDGSDINLSSPPPIGNTTPSTGTFTSLTGQTALLRGTGQNLFTFSEQFDNAAWGKNSCTIAADVTTAPNGTLTADKLQETATTNFFAISANPSAVFSTQYAHSFYAKSAERTQVAVSFTVSTAFAIFDLSAGTVSTSSGSSLVGASIVSVGNGWYRCQTVLNTVASGANPLFHIISAINAGNSTYAGTAGHGVFLWGAQIEMASSVGAYVPTTATAIYGTPSLSLSGVAGVSLQSNGALVLQPAGAGGIQAQPTTSTTAGGNARGTNAVDWQTSRNNQAQVASAQFSVLGGGTSNTCASFAGTVSGGASNTARGNYNVVAGGSSNQADGNFNNTFSAVVGGYNNLANGYLNFVGGGYGNSTNTTTAVTTQAASITSGLTAVTLSATNANIRVGQLIIATGINTFPPTYVQAISGTSLTLSQGATATNGSVTLSFFTPHGVVVGGGNNQATGAYSFIGGGGDAGNTAFRNTASGDWSVVCGGTRNTASGIASFVGGGGVSPPFGTFPNTASNVGSAVVGGFINTASGQGAFVGSGYINTANAQYSAIMGGQSGTTRVIAGNHVFPACVEPISSAQGVSQSALLILARQTTDATATVLTSNNGAATTNNQVIMPNNSAYFFRGEVVSGVTGGGNTKGWTIEGVIKRGANAASTALVGTPTVTSNYADAGAAAWVVAITADTTNGGLRITVTGQAATTIRWVAKVETTEMTF